MHKHSRKNKRRQLAATCTVNCDTEYGNLKHKNFYIDHAVQAGVVYSYTLQVRSSYMDKFEYITYDRRNEEYRDAEQVLHKNVSLTELGKQGWEVIFKYTDSNQFFLKRKIEDSASPSADVSIKNIESIGGEDAARALTRAAYTGAMMALDQFMEKQRQQQNPSRQSTDYEYSR